MKIDQPKNGCGAASLLQFAPSEAARTPSSLPVLSGLVAAIATGLFSTAAFAQTSVTVYGAVDLGVEWSNSGKGGTIREIAGGSLGSRWGFRGAEDLGNGLTTNFRLEGGFTPDDGQLAQGGRLFGREATVGLTSSTYGGVVLGRVPLPYYLALNGIDAFSWIGSGGMLSATRSSTSSQQLLPIAINGRADNAVAYVSPNLGGFELRALGARGEGSAAIGSMYSASVRYRKGPIDAVASYAQQNGANSSSGEVVAYVVGGSYDFGAVRMYAGLADEKNTCTSCTGALARGAGVAGSNASQFRMTNLGARMPFGALSVFTQVTRINDRSQYTVNPGDRDATWFGVGAEYALSKRTSLYGTMATVGNKNGSSYALGSGTAQQPANAVAPGNPRANTAVVGIRHFF